VTRRGRTWQIQVVRFQQQKPLADGRLIAIAGLQFVPNLKDAPYLAYSRKGRACVNVKRFQSADPFSPSLSCLLLH